MPRVYTVLISLLLALLLAPLPSHAQVAVSGSGNTISLLQDPTTGTVKNSLAKIGPTGAIRTGITDTGVDVYVVLSETSTAATVPAVLAVTGVVSCTMDATVSSTRGMFVVNSVTTPGFCHPQTAQPTNGFVAGRMIDNGTTSGQTALISAFNLAFIPGSGGAASISTGATGQLGFYAAPGTTISPLVITPTANFALVGNGASWVTSAVAMAGAGNCSASTVNTGNVANAVPNCNPVTSARVDTTVATTGLDLVAGTPTRVAGASGAFFWHSVAVTLSGQADNYNGCDGATICNLDGGATDRLITGLANGTTDRPLTLCNVGTTNKLILGDQNVNSSATNRFRFGGANVTLRPDSCKDVWYHTAATRWRLKDSALLDPYVRWTCRIGFGSKSAGAAPIPDDDDVTDACSNNTGVDVEITAVKVFAATGTPTFTPILTGGAAVTTLCTAVAGAWTACTLVGTPTLHTFSGAGMATCAVAPCTVDANPTTAGGTWAYGWLEFVGNLK